VAADSHPRWDNNRRPGIAGRMLGAVVGPLVTPVVDHVDVDDVVSRIDVDQVLQRVDLDEVLDRVDLEAVLDRVDPDRLLDRMDPNRLLERVDINRLVARIELEPLLERVDLDRVISRVDIDRIVQRVDVNAVVDRVDVNVVLERIDTDALVARTELGSLITRSTSGVLAKVLDILRANVMTADRMLHALVDRVLRRTASSGSGGDAAPAVVAPAGRWAREFEAQGRPAGMVSRLVAFLIDAFIVQVLYAASVNVFSLAYEILVGRTWTVDDHRIISGIAYLLFIFLYFAVPTAIGGRTLGKALLGVQVRRSDGSAVNWRHAALRTIAFPLSLVFFCAGLLMGVFRRDRRTLHDLIGGTQVVYAWDARAAHLRSLAERAAVP
jgi:uncharacterized RDD family membrane protein YckC